jgi:hypothetical protein
MMVEVAGGAQVDCGRIATLTVRLGKSHTTTVQAHVMSDCLQGVDLILGNNWLFAKKAVLDYSARTCHIHSDSGTTVLRSPVPRERAGLWLTAAAFCKVKMMSGKQAERMLRKGAPAVLLLVQDTRVKNKRAGPYSAHGALCAAAADAHLSQETRARLQALLEKYKDVIEELTSLPPERNVGHAIPLDGSGRPPFRRPYRLSQLEAQEVEKQVKEMLAKGFIEPSCSPYGAPVLFAPKKDGTLRMCIDYRQLNKQTVRDRFPLPRVDDLFDKLHGKCYFSSLDLQAGYYQIRIRPEDCPKTSFVTPGGQYQFKVLPMGLSNAPATFQREMHAMFHDMVGKHLLVYLDDLLIMSTSIEEHFTHLEWCLHV